MKSSEEVTAQKAKSKGKKTPAVTKAEKKLTAAKAGVAAAQKGVAAGAVIAQLEDSRTLKVVLTVPRGEKLKVGTPLQLKLGAVAASAVVEKVDGASAEANLDNAKGTFKGGATGASSFAGAPKSLLSRL